MSSDGTQKIRYLDADGNVQEMDAPRTWIVLEGGTLDNTVEINVYGADAEALRRWAFGEPEPMDPALDC